MQLSGQGRLSLWASEARKGLVQEEGLDEPLFEGGLFQFEFTLILPPPEGLPGGSEATNGSSWGWEAGDGLGLTDSSRV